MPNEYVIAKAREFLEVVGGEVQAKFGDTPRATQVAVWWSEAGPGDSRVTVRSRGSSTTLRIGRHEREVFAWDGVNAFYQNDLSRRDFPEQTELHDAITAAGFDAQGIRFQLLIPLVCPAPDWGQRARFPPPPTPRSNSSKFRRSDATLRSRIRQNSALRHRPPNSGEFDYPKTWN